MLAGMVRAWIGALGWLLIGSIGGWVVLQLCLQVAGPIQANHPWVGVGLLSLGLVAYLSGLIIGIRAAGTAAGIWDILPDDIVRIGRDEPLVRVIGMSLLPFVGVYSAFGGIEQATYNLFIAGVLQDGISTQATATEILDPVDARGRLVIGAVLVFTYAIRRLLDAFVARFGLEILRLASALVEGFFSVVLVFGGSRMLSDLRAWLSTRQIAEDLQTMWAAMSDVLGQIHIDLPQAIVGAWQFLTQTVWPLFLNGLVEPMLWLAVAGLVFGTYTVSAAELWHAPTEQDLAKRKFRNARLEHLEMRVLSASEESKYVATNTTDVVMTDLEDRIIPFIQSTRHVLRRGIGFAAVFSLLYSVVAFIPDVVLLVAYEIVGGQKFETWLAVTPLVSLIGVAIGEPLRMSLLAVVMTMTFLPRTEDPIRGLRGVVAFLMAAILVTLGGLISELKVDGPSQDLRHVTGRSGELAQGVILTVEDMQASEYAESGGVRYQTPGSFMAVTVSLATTGREDTVATCYLLTTDSAGNEISNEVVLGSAARHVSPEPGFREYHTLVYERPTEELVGAQLRCESSELLVSYHRALQFDLEIDQARLAEIEDDSVAIAVDESHIEVIQ